IFLERKDATSIWAWLLVLFFIPILGFIIYLIFGKPIYRRRIFTWDTKSRLGVKKAVKQQLEALKSKTFTFNNPEIARYEDLIYMHLRNDDAIYTQNNAVDVFTDGHEKFNQLIKDLESAKDHIHLQYYIVRDDGLGDRLAETLIKKAKEGVKVRFLFDDLGSRRLRNKYIKRLRIAGIQVEAFFPSKLMLNLKINY